MHQKYTTHSLYIIIIHKQRAAFVCVLSTNGSPGKEEKYHVTFGTVFLPGDGVFYLLWQQVALWLNLNVSRHWEDNKGQKDGGLKSWMSSQQVSLWLLLTKKIKCDNV